MMRDSMVHRGPDDSDVWWSPDRQVGLGHRRLAIIDLSPGGHQPMLDCRGELVITFNGEIYNYQELRRELQGRGHHFRTASDTEVILEAYREWGTACVSRFNGMFAFSLYDVALKQLFLARDRAGEKPLYYRHSSDGFIFASELKAIMSDPRMQRKINLYSLDQYLTYGYISGSRCIIEGVDKLPQAHAMVYKLETNELHRWCYWKLPEPSEQNNLFSDVLLDELETLLRDSVRLRLIADVPVGIMLSGGLDSSLVAAIAAQVSSHPVNTFTASFPGNKDFDESPHARLVAQHFGTKHSELAIEPASVDLLSELVRQFDEPIGDQSIIPTYLISRLIKGSAKVALVGDGGDELFGGYPHYSLILRLNRLRSCFSPMVRKLISDLASRFLPVGTRGRNHLIGFHKELSYSIAHINLFFDFFTRKHLLSPLAKRMTISHISQEVARSYAFPSDLSAVQQMTMMDFKTTMVDDYLVKVDRASMMASLEVRAPFLDHRLVEFAFARVPDDLRVTASERKILLRLLAKRLLPATLDLRRKQGFVMPLATWFNGKWGDFMCDVLEGADQDLFDKGEIRKLIVLQKKGYANTHRLFALTMFELWRRHYKVSI